MLRDFQRGAFFFHLFTFSPFSLRDKKKKRSSRIASPKTKTNNYY